jgi:hypothetical protein
MHNGCLVSWCHADRDFAILELRRHTTETGCLCLISRAAEISDLCGPEGQECLFCLFILALRGMFFIAGAPDALLC